MDPTRLLARVRETGPGSPISKLATLVVDDVLARKVGELVDPKLLTAQLHEVLRTLAASDAAETNATKRAQEVTGDLETDTRALATTVPKALRDGARAIAELPLVPRHDAVMTLLDREPVKALLRAQVVDTLVAFGRRAASPVADNAIARGIGGISKLVASRPSALGRMATAVSSEVEKQVEKRANDFADTAVGSVLESVAEQASDPGRAKEQAAMRVALLDGLHELAPAEVAVTVKGHEGAIVRHARKALAAWVADPSFAKDVEDAITKVLARDLARPLGDVLADLGLRDVAAVHARAHVERVLAPFVAGDAFGAWIAVISAD